MIIYFSTTCSFLAYTYTSKKTLIDFFACPSFFYRWYNKDITRTEAEELLIAVVNTHKLLNDIR